MSSIIQDLYSTKSWGKRFVKNLYFSYKYTF